VAYDLEEVAKVQEVRRLMEKAGVAEEYLCVHAASTTNLS
jgi:hypothetical protein